MLYESSRLIRSDAPFEVLGLCHRGPVRNQLLGLGYAIPHIPMDHPHHLAVFEVIQHPFCAKGGPVGKDVELTVDGADGLIPHGIEVGIEEGQMAIGFAAPAIFSPANRPWMFWPIRFVSSV